MANPTFDSSNAASSPFWNLQASDLLKTGVEYLSSLSSSKMAKSLTVAQQSSVPSSTPDSVKKAFTAPTNIASIAAIVGLGFVMIAGGAYVWRKVT